MSSIGKLALLAISIRVLVGPCLGRWQHMESDGEFWAAAPSISKIRARDRVRDTAMVRDTARVNG